MRIGIKGALGVGALTVLVVGGLRAGPDDASGPGAQPSTPVQAPELDAKLLAELALEHSRSRDELLAAEARLALLAEKLFHSRLQVDYRGELDTPFQLVSVELTLDGALVYRKDFERATTAQALKLFDGALPPGRHVLEVRVRARGPDEPQDDLPGYSAGSGLAVHLRQGSDTRVVFEAQQDGHAPQGDELKGDRPGGSWQVEIDARSTTEPAR